MTQAASSLTAAPASVRDLIAQIVGIPPDRVVGSAALGADLGATSLDSVELVMAIEDEFGVEISDDRAAAIVTVDDLESLVLELQAARRARPATQVETHRES
ncbi:acyl carrier protein [Reyranella sp.]|uniref:acyl carrier protein n=1 Tax=Reyranella sp. TaxID=1929291 RepID=UPI003D0C7C26